jgi:hypothetical protein
MTPTPTQVRDALKRWDDSEAPLLGLNHVEPFVAAARAWLDLHTECEKCGGSGEVRLAPGLLSGGWITDPCPACDGRGYTLNEDRWQAASQSLQLLGHSVDHSEVIALTAILAYLGEPQ